MNTALDDRPIAVPRGGSTARRVVAGILLPAGTAVIAVIGLRTDVHSAIPDLQAVAFGLVIVGALSAVVLGRAPERAPQWQVTLGPLVAAVALTASRIGDEAPRGQHQAARAIATLAVPLLVAIWVHLLLALPDGQLIGRSRRVAAILAYAAAVTTGLAAAIAGRPIHAGVVALIWPLATVCAFPAVRSVTPRRRAATGSGCSG